MSMGRSLALLAVVAMLTAAGSGPAIAARAGSRPPTAGAIREWRSAVLKPSHLSTWWRRYLGKHPALVGCHTQTINHQGLYTCTVTGGANPATAILTRTHHPCGYHSHLTTLHHNEVYNFKFCG